MRSVWLVLLFVLAALTPFAWAEEQDSPNQLYQQALHLEGTGELDAAMAGYRSIVARREESGVYAARALYRLGACHEKRADADGATRCAQQLQREFGATLVTKPAWQHFVRRYAAEGGAAGGAPASTLAHKLAEILMPAVSLRRMPLPRVLQWLQAESIRMDPARTGVNLVWRRAPPGPPLPDEAAGAGTPAITLSLADVSLRQVLDRVSRQIGYRFTVLDDRVVIAARDVRIGPLVTRIYSLSTEDFENLARRAKQAPHPPRVPGTDPPPIPDVGAEMSDCTDFFRRCGVLFPRGATAMYEPFKNWLVVKNEEDGHTEMRRCLAPLLETP